MYTLKVICWEVAHKCVNTSEMIQRWCKGWCLLPHVCHLCLQEGELVNHLFIHCPYVSEIWWYFISTFGVSMVLLLEITDLLRLWYGAPFKKRGKALWRYLPSIIIWSVWEERNLRILHDKKRSVKQLLECISIRLAFWASKEPCFKGISVDNLTRDLTNIINSAPTCP